MPKMRFSNKRAKPQPQTDAGTAQAATRKLRALSAASRKDGVLYWDELAPMRCWWMSRIYTKSLFHPNITMWWVLTRQARARRLICI